MGVQAYLYQAGKRVTQLPDPSGGHFDAAGDFDRLLPAGTAFAVLGQIDPYGDLELGPHTMPSLVAELDQLLPQARPGAERRGLLRLKTMALACQAATDTVLIFRGD